MSDPADILPPDSLFERVAERDRCLGCGEYVMPNSEARTAHISGNCEAWEAHCRGEKVPGWEDSEIRGCEGEWVMCSQSAPGSEASTSALSAPDGGSSPNARKTPTGGECSPDTGPELAAEHGLLWWLTREFGERVT